MIRLFEDDFEKAVREQDEYRRIWLRIVREQLKEDEFHLPLEPKAISKMNEVENFLLDNSNFTLVVDKVSAINFFKCKLKSK